MSLAKIEALLANRLNDTVECLEPYMLQHPQVDIPATETFANGVYTRQILIPKGTLLTGRVWLNDYIDIMVYGHILVATPDGTRELEGFNKLDGQGGRKRIGYALEDTLWITLHDFAGTACDDALEQLSVFHMQEYRDIIIERSQLDFNRVFGAIADGIRTESEDPRNRFDLNLSTVEVKASPIEGVGLFATTEFKPGAIIMPARFKGLKTEGGRYCNHSVAPNAKMLLVNGDVVLQATQHIFAGAEITTNYVNTLTVLGGSQCLESQPQ